MSYLTKRAKEDLLIRNFESFFNQRKKDGVTRINGELPPKQRKIMNTILQRASEIYNERDFDTIS